MDADLSHDPIHLPHFFEKIQDHDLVVGSRYLQGINVVTGLEATDHEQAGDQLCAFRDSKPFSDTTSGFKCWRREALESIGFEDAFPADMCSC